MKNFFTYVAIIGLGLFSFYYTDKVVNILRENDPMMIEIMKLEDSENIPCAEGYVEDTGVVIGVSGKVINKIESFNNMRGIGFDESLLVFEPSKCVVTKENYLDKYIIRGNKEKEAVTIIIDSEDIDSYENIASAKGIEFTYIITDKNVESIGKKGKSFVYSGNTEKGIKKYIKNMNNIGEEPICIASYNDNIDLCKKHGVSTVKPDIFIEKNILPEAKENIYKGSFLVIRNTKSTTPSEVSILVNYIRNKGYKILDISEHISNER